MYVYVCKKAAKTTFVQKKRAKNVDEIDGRFVQKANNTGKN
jgi:hypothetical protein